MSTQYALVSTSGHKIGLIDIDDRFAEAAIMAAELGKPISLWPVIAFDSGECRLIKFTVSHTPCEPSPVDSKSYVERRLAEELDLDKIKNPPKIQERSPLSSLTEQPAWGPESPPDFRVSADYPGFTARPQNSADGAC